MRSVDRKRRMRVVVVAATLLVWGGAWSVAGFEGGGLSSPPASRRDVLEGLVKGGLLLGASATRASPAAAAAAASSGPSVARVTLGSLEGVCRVMNGMWQLSGAHGFTPELSSGLDAMKRHIDAGLCTFDLADHYGPAEQFVGAFRSKYPEEASKAQFLTKWVPRPFPVAERGYVDAAVKRSCSQMRTSKLDMLQFHWWDYGVPAYLDTLSMLANDERVDNLALTNFDTQHLDLITGSKWGIPIVSNQVQYSILDDRPAKLMAPLCEARGVKLLCYGTVLGGFMASDKWLGKPEPAYQSLETVSLKKYFVMIRAWGGWEKFQTLLGAVKNVADRHGVSVADVAVRWVLQQPAVGSAIVGVRLGLRDHIADTSKVWGFELSQKDLDEIAEAKKGSRDLMAVIGDCGDEYRG